jgi:hypothetical protein
VITTTSPGYDNLKHPPVDKDLYNRSQNCIREGQRIPYDHEALSSVTDVLCIVCKKDTATTMPKKGYSIMDGSNNINDANDDDDPDSKHDNEQSWPATRQCYRKTICDGCTLLYPNVPFIRKFASVLGRDYG